jgi:branched-chain amino acid transport system ATP-binding protein
VRNMLRVRDLEVAYGDFQVLWAVDLHVQEGEIVCVLGPNGAGKSTLMNTISGLLKPKSGSIEFRGERIDGVPAHEIVQKGLSHVLERRRIFPYLTVRENLILGSYAPKAKQGRAEAMERVLDLFPVLGERQKQMGSLLSGGEQQMLAIGRGLMSNPKFLMLDEPFLGLAPSYVDLIMDTMKLISESGVTILFIEQDVVGALGLSDRGYVLESGRVVLENTGESLLGSEMVRKVYMGL